MSKVCIFCQKLFETTDNRRHYCSNDCKKKSIRKKKREAKRNGKPKRLICGGYQSTDDNIAQRVRCKTSRFEYICGWTNINGYAYLECKDCGLIFKHSTEFLKPSNHKAVRCPNCGKKKEYAPASKVKSRCLSCGIEIVGNRKKKYCSGNCANRQWKIDNDYKPKHKIKPKQLQFKQCEWCHNLFIPEHKRSIYCSDECKRKSANHKQEIKERVKGNPREIGKINLKVLYERDKGICALCGGLCDWNDYEWKNNAFYTGEKYPTRDHIIPLSKGGIDSWNNIQLAHFKCNREKGNNYE